MKRMRTFFFSILICTVISSSFISNVSLAAGELSDEEVEANFMERESILNEKYSTYIANIENVYAGNEIVLDQVHELVAESSDLFTYEGDEVIKVDQNKDVTLIVNAPEDHHYQIAFNYLIDDENVLPTQLSLSVNGEIPYYELRNLIFESKWASPDTIPLDKYGNEIVPQPYKVYEWQEKFLIDSSYRSSEPLLIPLDKGENELTLSVQEGTLLIKALRLTGKENLDNYEYSEVSGDELITIQGETIMSRNDSSIRAGSSFNVDLAPYHSSKRVLNYLDDSSFKNAGQKVSYEFEVEEAGYYYVGMNYRQNARDDFPVFIHILINDEIPVLEYQNYPLDYTSEFKVHTLTDFESDRPIPIYLEEGLHTLSFVISLDPLKNTIEAIEQLIHEIQLLSLELNNLAGPNADRHRDINVEEFIPGVTDQLLSWADTMLTLYEDVSVYNPDVPQIGAFANLNIAEQQLRSLADDIDRLVVRKNELSTGTNSVTAQLGNLLQSIIDNGIAFDRIYLYQEDAELPSKTGFFQAQQAKITRLFQSFGDQDYSIDRKNPDHLQVWINRPRQYIEIIQQMIDEQFTPETGIQVDISIMPDQNKLILANAAGEAPDVAVGVNYALPFEIAIRGALQDLTEFEDFPEIKTRFPEGLHIPATVGDGIYALPDTMNFWVLFYRKDILESLELPVPNTIDELQTYLPELRRRGMNFFYPTAGMPGIKLFPGTMPLIYQNDGRFYGENIDRTHFNENASVEGMRQLTELFTIYNAPYDVPSFYQQFRDGSLPIGISDYFMYNLILNAAPEIANSWDIALMPGIENEDGEIERWSAGGAESNIIFEDSDKKDEAWEFLKWWSSTDVQIAFGNTLQITYGEEYIWNTANIEAYAGLPWNSSHKETIIAQTEWVTEVPRVPGSYMLEREVSNAYNSIILDGENLRTAIDLASKRINRETQRKLEEFEYIKDGELIEEYPNPEFNLK